ncbi:hypothetical protein GCM10020331_022550 [Ectobacillus funiculus]
MIGMMRQPKNLMSEAKIFSKAAKKGSVRHRFIPTDGAYLKQTFLDLIEEAKHDLYIGTPYFIPGKELADALVAAAKRGVRIAILVPKKSGSFLCERGEVSVLAAPAESRLHCL